MSLLRLVYYSAVIGGWSAFLGWLVAEWIFAAGEASGGWPGVVATCATVGAAIGAGLNLVAGMANARWKELLRRGIAGLVAGSLGGAIGGGLGEAFYSAIGLPRALGWMIMGAAIGLGGGLSERSRREVRNGLIGGTIGGLVGGLLFDPILGAIHSGTGMTSRSIAFVLLGISIGALIGLVRVVLKDAWLTVLDGYRPGRQVILGDGVAILGRAEYATLPFLGPGDAKLDWEHARIARGPDGRFVVEPKASTALAVRLNREPIALPTTLADGDVLTLGGNSIRYNERTHRSAGPTTAEPHAPTVAGSGAHGPVPPVLAPKPADRPVEPDSEPVRTIGGTPTDPLVRSAPTRSSSTEPTPTASVTAATTGPVCPRCGRAPARGQRYCIVCDEGF